MSERLANPPGEGQLEELVIEDVETLKAVADPLRMRLHTELDKPQTVKELASALGVPPTRLYYHMKILERAGLIRVIARRVVSGIEEKTYQTTAKSTTVSPALGAMLAESGALEALLDLVATELEIALQDPTPVGDPNGSVLALSLTHVFLAPDQTEEFQKRVFDLIAEYNEPVRDASNEYQIFFEAHRKRGGVSDAS